MQLIVASRVAQWIERSFPKRQVVGSNPISGDSIWLAVLSEMMMLASNHYSRRQSPVTTNTLKAASEDESLFHEFDINCRAANITKF